jgi:hypothetical protein
MTGVTWLRLFTFGGKNHEDVFSARYGDRYIFGVLLFNDHRYESDVSAGLGDARFLKRRRR